MSIFIIIPMNAVEKSGLLVLKWSDYYVESVSSSSETSKYFIRIIKYSENYRDEKKGLPPPLALGVWRNVSGTLVDL
jgi:hypothetical protein